MDFQLVVLVKATRPAHAVAPPVLRGHPLGLKCIQPPRHAPCHRCLLT